ncbi:hypothetical protein HHK36_030235 [Tetracentron sinense]|uniref:Retroviral polymerase SH3-like domain-containing protein n=1 Tax=Tetracentron sinense TaxID=13715 RepID=A0A834YF65_TETSI|nr:hypothetical protein HHK36_030235 [Tetracentron sinense]
MDTSVKIHSYGPKGRSNWMPLSSIPELFRGISLTRPDYYTAVTSENDEEFVKWQKEVTEAEVEAEVLKHGSTSSGVGSDQLKDYEGDANDRPLTPPDGEEEFIDDDGTTYKWDRGLRLWVPQDYTFCSDERYKVREMTFLEEEEVFPTLQVADTSVMEEVNGTSEGVEAKLDLKRKLPDKHAEKKEANKPPDSWFDLKVNSHVDVTGLPDDVTAEEDLQLPSIKGASKFLHIRCPTKSVKNKTPQEAWSGYKPSVSHLKIFGYIAYAQVPEAKRKKLDDRSEKCIFIGYSEESKAYKLYNPLTNKVVVSRDVIFSEEETWNWDKEEKIKENQIEIEEQEADHGEQNQENMRQTISTPAPCASSSIVRRSPDARLITPEEARQQVDGIFISQKRNAMELLKKFRLDGCNTVSTPVAMGSKLTKEGEGKTVDSTLFKSLIGSLRYLTITRPDIVYGVGLLSRYMETPKESHWLAAKRILRYISGTLEFGLFYSYNEDAELYGYSDSDWGGDQDECKSTTGSLQFLWLSKFWTGHLCVLEARFLWEKFMAKQLEKKTKKLKKVEEKILGWGKRHMHPLEVQDATHFSLTTQEHSPSSLKTSGLSKGTKTLEMSERDKPIAESKEGDPVSRCRNQEEGLRDFNPTVLRASRKL